MMLQNLNLAQGYAAVYEKGATRYSRIQLPNAARLAEKLDARTYVRIGDNLYPKSGDSPHIWAAIWPGIFPVPPRNIALGDYRDGGTICFREGSEQRWHKLLKEDLPFRAAVLNSGLVNSFLASGVSFARTAPEKVWPVVGPFIVASLPLHCVTGKEVEHAAA